MEKGKRTLPQGKINKSGLIDVLLSMLLTALIAYLFYRSYYAMILFPAVYLFFGRRLKRSREKKELKKRRNEYREMLLSVSNSLSTGYSVENAFKEAGSELLMMYGKDSWIVKSLYGINRKVSLSIPIEKAFLEFSEENKEIEEIRSFSEIFSFAKRLGGDYAKHIKGTAKKLGERIELLSEIDVMTSEKRMELNVMCIMPGAIILYQNIFAPEFLDPVYGNIRGIILMSVCLLFYALMVYLGDRIVDIKV